MKYIIMCAGSGKRYLKPYPKHIETICGEPNYKRTIRLLQENNIADISISVSKVNERLFDFPNKIIGSNIREIDRFRNLRAVITEPVTILYGDVVYFASDITKIVDSTDANTTFFGRLNGNLLTGKKYGEIMGVIVQDYAQFFHSVDVVADKFERGIIDRELGWEVYDELKTNFITLSDKSDDYDTIQEYITIKNIYEGIKPSIPPMPPKPLSPIKRKHVLIKLSKF